MKRHHTILIYRASQGRGLLRALFWMMFFISTLIAIIFGYQYVGLLKQQIITKFEGKRWSLPARVYARAMDLYPGMQLNPNALEKELELMRYRKEENPSKPGSYYKENHHITLVTRGFIFEDGKEESQKLSLSFDNNYLTKITSLDHHPDPAILRLDPVLIGSFYPQHGEDRVLIQIEDVPELLIKTLVAVEDRSFFQHNGLNYKGIIRAIIANIKAGRTVQGGSTLTQQLVKNFFLTQERTLKRKFNEAIMALILENLYSKEEILETYFNEIYLGHEGNRDIHGFGLASLFYFNRAINELELHHIALLVGLAKGASYYDPRQHPERALERRNLILRLLAEQGIITPALAETTQQLPLDVTPNTPKGRTLFPAFFDLVQRELKQQYHEQDLRSQGLRIFTHLDPQIQLTAEQAITKKLAEIEKSKNIPENTLETAVVIANSETGEIVSLIGGREAGYAGFNRALDANRLIGSLIKPVVYLTALESNKPHYHLASLLEDKAISLDVGTGKPWQPQNYDKTYHGEVPFYKALAKSYNLATVNLGLAIGLERIIFNLQRLGITDNISPYPSLLLGAIELSPFQITQIYQTFAANGFKVPLRSIQSVLDEDNQPLKHYPLEVQKVFNSNIAFLINSALQKVVGEGTAIALKRIIPESLGLAGKTGTTDNLKDSWFAGFSGNLVAVVWIGRDDNKPAKLTGASGALRIWGEIMKDLPLEPVTLNPNNSIIYVYIDPVNGLLADPFCKGSIILPFEEDNLPEKRSPRCH